MATEVRHRRATTAHLATKTPAQSEFIHNVETNRIHVGDGTRVGGHAVALLSDVNALVNYFGSVAEATAFSYSPEMNSVFIFGYYAAGDGGFSIYNRVAVEPTHAGKFKSADGSWWELFVDQLSLEQLGGGVSRSGAENSSAIDKCIGILGAEGGSIYLGAGDYKFATQITIPSKCHIKGQGRNVTFLTFNGTNGVTTTNTAALFDTNSPEGASYWGLHGLTIYGSRDNGAAVGHGIYTYSRCYVLRDVAVVNFAESGIRSRWYHDAAWDDPAAWRYDLFMEARYEGVYVSYCGGHGIDFDGPHDSQWSNVLVGLCSIGRDGLANGIHIGSRSGGLQAVNCHSWGNYQYSAWNITGGWLHFTNCEADGARTCLIYMEGTNIVWEGGVQFNAIFGTPSSFDKAITGFQLSHPAGAECDNIRIQTVVNNCPGGSIAFGKVRADGTGSVDIIGSIQNDVVAGSNGWAGDYPPNWDVAVNIRGAAFRNKLHRSAQGVIYVPQRASDPTDTWTKGMLYFNTTLNKFRGYNGTAWVDV